MEVEEIVIKLVGEIEPTGETNTDTERLKNLKALTAVVDSLLYEIHQVSRRIGYEASVQEAVKVAKGFFRHINEEYEIQDTTKEA